MPIPVTRSSMPDFEEYAAEIKEIWQTRWLTNKGIKHQALEAQLQSFLMVPNMSLFTNGHLALEYAFKAFQLSGEVITTPFTFASTTHAIVRCGLHPVFCDINPRDYTIDVEKIEALITERTTAIIPVHVYGNICDVGQIQKIAQKHGLRIIYDAAHSFGVTVNGRGIGTFGDASMFSFHATKVFHTIEGGALTYRDQRIKPILESLKNFGITDYDQVDYVGGNAKMNEFQAAMGLCNLRHIEREITKRKAVAERYASHLSGVAGIKLTPEQNDVTCNYAYFPVVFDGYAKTRDDVYAELQAHDIHARKYFFPTTNSFACYDGKYPATATPVARHIAECVLSLPLYADLELDVVDRICTIIKKGR